MVARFRRDDSAWAASKSAQLRIGWAHLSRSAFGAIICAVSALVTLFVIRRREALQTHEINSQAILPGLPRRSPRSPVYDVQRAFLHVERGFSDRFAQGGMRMSRCGRYLRSCRRIQLPKRLRRLVPKRRDAKCARRECDRFSRRRRT